LKELLMTKLYVGQRLTYPDHFSMSPLEHMVRSTDGRHETFSRIYAGTRGSASVSGQIALMPLPLPAGRVVSSLSVCTGTVAGSTLTHWWHALLDSNYNMLAVTTDDTTTTSSTNALKTLNVAKIASGSASSFTTTYEGLHYMGVMIASSAGANIPSLTGIGAISGPIANAVPAFGLTDSGLTTPPVFPYTAPTPSTTAIAYYGYVL
jgi:hypothetical protein